MKSIANNTRSQWRANSHRGEVICDSHDGRAGCADGAHVAMVLSTNTTCEPAAQ